MESGSLFQVSVDHLRELIVMPFLRASSAAVTTTLMNSRVSQNTYFEKSLLPRAIIYLTHLKCVCMILEVVYDRPLE